MHGKMHKMRSVNNFLYKCLKSNCDSTFETKNMLDIHMRVHNNETDNCQYCPYRYVEPASYRVHLNNHFRIKEHKCGHCGKLFASKKYLKAHESKHEGIIYCCLICKTYEIERKNSMLDHLRRCHSDMLGQNIIWEIVKTYVELK